MADSTVSAATASASAFSPADLLARPPIKRARAQLSCVPCRTGKLKCNREHPVCDQCTKRARPDACQYVPPPPRNKQAHNMRGRIRNLESLVVTLINQKAAQDPQNGSVTTTSSTGSQDDGDVRKERASVEAPSVQSQEREEEPILDSFGQLRIKSSGTGNYASAGHWSTILKEIEAVKENLDDDDWADEVQEEEWDSFNARSSVTFGVPKPTSKAMLIQELHIVGRKEIDRLLPLWFNSADPLLFMIHAPTFLEEYKQFWKDPTNTSVMWIAMLFSIMALGIIVGPRNPGMNLTTTAPGSHGTPNDESDYLFKAVDRFQQFASSAMVLGDIAKALPYTIEALMIYAECEFLRRDDQHTKVWLMNGVLLRVAMRMGYHRDPSNFRGITPFQTEMRRRIFHVLNMMDTLISFAIGLPRALRSLDSDVRVPRNLYDTDFSPSSTELPKERPHSEITPALYSIAKSRMCVVFAEAVELSQKIVPPKHSYIMELTKRLEDAHDIIPEGLRVRPLEDCITDPPTLIMARFNIELLYQKALLVLHRNYLIAGQSDAKFARSRTICLTAAKDTLRYHETIFHACQAGGQLNKVWWYMSSLNTYDFLLAAMVLCLELHHVRISEQNSEYVDELVGILKNTHSIWANNHNRFRESVRGAAILKEMIDRYGAAGSQCPSVKDTASDSTYAQNTSPMGSAPEVVPEELPPQIWSSLYTSHEVQPFDALNIPAGVDWTRWDSTMQGQTHMLPQHHWAAPQSNNPALDQWMNISFDLGTEVGAFPDNMYNFQDPLNVPNATGYVPPPPHMNWSV